MSNLSKRVVDLTPEQLELIVRQAGKKRKETARATISLQPRTTGAFPMSFAQQRLWFIEQLAPGNTAYNIHEAVHLTGPLNVAALQQSLNEIIRRHETLRTSFTLVDGAPAQVIAPSLTLTLPIVDHREHSATEREAEVRRQVIEEAQLPFDLEQAPLLRAKLLRLAQTEYVLLLTMHHIISDSWSVGVFVRELAALYGAFSANRPSPLPELPIQYADFTAWQQTTLQGEVRGQGSGVRGQGSARQGDKETRRQGDGEQGMLDSQSPIPNPQSPVPDLPSPIPHPPSPIEAQLDYWRKQLGGPLPVLDLITDRPRPPVQTFNGARHPLSLPQALYPALGALSRQEGATLFMTLLAAYQALLYRYTGQEDVIVGSPIAGRRRPELEGLIGFFANTLVMRGDLAGSPSFRELLRRVRKVCLDAYANQDVPFDRLVEELQPARDLSRNPLFQTVFVLQNTPMSGLTLPGLTSRSIYADSGKALFDLTVELVETDGALVGSIEYNTDLFDAATIDRFAGHLRALLERIVAGPDLCIADISLLADAERQQVLSTWNSTRTAYPRDATIHELFEAQAARTPNAAALHFDGQRLSYYELNQRANQLAHDLRAHGVGPEVHVAICLERSLELIVAILGILKAGGVYVPLDPAYPPERLAFMLEDAKVAVLLTTTDHRPPTTVRGQGSEVRGQTLERVKLKTQNSKLKTPVVVNLDADWPRIAQQRTDNPPNRTTADHLAYVIYTSGSTGQPKGVSVPHRGVVRLVMATNYASFGDNEVFLQLAPMTFDAATFELWGSLLHGGQLVVFPPHQPTLEELGATLQKYQVTTLWLTAGLFHQMVERNLNNLTNVRQILAGGDVLSVPLVHKMLQAQGKYHLINGYGPTESTTFTCCYPITDPAQIGRSVPIGRPIANTEVYLLDARLRPVPIGVPGELYIGGDGLARGYLNQPELTAERFIPNPFTDFGLPILDFGLPEAEYPIQNPKSKIQNGTRLYKTGDRARFRPDGSIEFLGRLDKQVKIRGYRIEPGEIEKRLAQHPAVRDAVVLAREDTPGDKQLVVYVVQGSGVRGQGSEDAALIPDPRSLIPDLRAFLKERLPGYMVPSAFVLLDELPLTPNGKVDQRALPAPETFRPDNERGYVAARMPEEEILVQIWGDVLKQKQIGVYDNFFEAGGHSLLAIQVVSQICEAFHVDLTLISLYEAPTIAELAVLIVQKRAEQADDAALEQVLAQIEDLSEDEAQTLLGSPPPADHAALESALSELEHLSDEDAQHLLAARNHGTGQAIDQEALEQLLAELEDLSNDEVQTLLASREDVKSDANARRI